MSIIWNYNARKFRAETPDPGPFGGERTIFSFEQDQDIVSGSYQGAEVIHGLFMGLMGPDGVVEMRYLHVSRGGSLIAGQTRMTPEILDDGRYRLTSVWEHTAGNTGQGKSVLVQIQE